MPTHTGQHEVCLNKPENHPLSMQNRTSINLIFNHTCSCAFRISDSFLKDKIILQGSINLINRIFNALSFDIMKNDSISVEIPSPKKKLCSILLLTFVVGVLDKMGISFLEQYHRQAIQMIES